MYIALHNHELNEMSLEEDGLPKALADGGVLELLGLIENFDLKNVDLLKVKPTRLKAITRSPSTTSFTSCPRTLSRPS